MALTSSSSSLSNQLGRSSEITSAAAQLPSTITGAIRTELFGSRPGQEKAGWSPARPRRSTLPAVIAAPGIPAPVGTRSPV